MSEWIEIDEAFLEYMHTDDYAEIYEVLVWEGCRGKGFGSKVMESFLMEMRKRNVKIVTLEVRVDNLIAISLYEKFGFEQVSVRNGYYDGVDGLLMKLELK